MTAFACWTQLPADGLTVAAYDALPEEVCRRIEVIDEAMILHAPPRRSHQRIVRRFADALEAARGPDLAVDFDVDLRLRDVPLLNRRPDVAVYRSTVSDDTVLRPHHCVLVVEVMSPGSVTADQTDKPAEYAAAGIEHYWRVEQQEQDGLVVFRYRLDPTTRIYASAGISTDKLAVSDPFPVSVDLTELI